MSGYDQTIKIKAKYYHQAKEFFAFLKSVCRKYDRPTKVNYRYLGRGRFYVFVDGNPGGIDALFQELILNKGLYYYLCTIKNNKRDVVNNVVMPIYRDLLDYRFSNPYSRFLRRHLTGKAIEEKYIPGEFSNELCHEYEILFLKWYIGLLDNWNFIKDLDFLLTKFMLKKLNHQTGEKSPKFHILVDQVYRKGVGMVPEIKSLFNKIHNLRTNGLHRLASNISRENISELAFETYNYFQYFDEFDQSQKEKTDKLHGKFYKRIKWGDEKWLNEDGKPFKDDNGNDLTMEIISKKPCHDCACIKGQYHCFGCDMEICPRCGGQRFGCGCKLDKDY